jgi:hypothetical protein
VFNDARYFLAEADVPPLLDIKHIQTVISCLEGSPSADLSFGMREPFNNY